MSSKSKHFKSKKEKKLISLIKNPDTEDEDSEHELSYYVNDRVQLMKEILKVIRPKKIKAMAPDCLKDMEIEEVNSLLLEELLGISNKRLKYIFEGKNLEEESSSSEDEQKPVDIISLDDISEDELILIDSDEDTVGKGRTKHKHKIKEENFKRKKVKKEKQEKDKITDKSKDSNKIRAKEDGNDKLMSVLELLELQARARAIRSQLALENSKKASEKEEEGKLDDAIEEDEDDAVIIQSPKNEEIVITSSESEIEDTIETYQNGEDSGGNGKSDTSKTQLISQNMQNEDQDIHNKKNISDVAGNITSIPLPDEESISNSKCNSTEGETSETGIPALSFTSCTLAADKESDIIVKGDKQQEIMQTDESLKNPSNEQQRESSSNDFISHACKDEEIVKCHNGKTSDKDVDLKKKRLKDFKNKIKSYKNELDLEGKIQIMENITIKKPVHLPKGTGDPPQDGDGLIINVDQDEMDCIICD